MSYLVSGNNPAAIKTAERNIFTATASQTTFTISQGYQPGDIDVFLNGVRLVDTEDYIANNGTTVVLNSGAAVGDSVVVVCFRPFQVADFYTKSEQDTRYVNAAGDTLTGPMQIWNSTQSAYSTNLADSVTTSALQLRTHATDSTLTTFGVISGGDGYIQRSNGPGTGSYNLRLNPYGGAVLMPYQPSFCAVKSGNFTEASGATVITSWSEYHDNGTPGGCFNASTGRFTAPVSGYYALHLNAMSYSTTGDAQWRWNKNGSTYVGSNNTTSGTPRQTTVSCVMYLAANDYAEPIAYSSTTSSGIMCYGGNYSHVSGHLIG